MAIGVDSSKWKPRKVAGTPAAAFRNKLAAGILAVGMFTGCLFHFTSISNVHKRFSEKFYEDPVEEVERRMMIGSGLPNRTSEMIKKLMEEDARVDVPHNKKFSQCEVRSKYFTERPVMDESLSDFQEKKNFTGPKKTEKAVSNNKPKKRIKRIKGQKDIRSALKSKKNELVAYANDFDKVCKQSGIDVDSEQLQLAIALSKSLQQPEGVLEASDSQNSGPLTSQERTGKIRTTLLEYGFKVPEIKITATKSRKLKRHRKKYKLLLASEAEKQQLISDKYSEVLFQNIKNIIVENFNNNKISESKAPLCHIATDISYENVRSNERFYIKDLIEVNHVCAGGLLKDWSEIPGRPSTPLVELQDIKFTDIDCSQEELDVILAGTIQSAQEVVKKKYKMSCDLSNETDRPMQTSENKVNHPLMIMDTISPQILSVTTQVRSCSPDIFDDEVSSITDISKDDNEKLSQENSCKDVTKSRSNYMDLTECVNFLSEQTLNTNKTTLKINSNVISQLSQEENITKRRSNDFMEITECVARSSQPVTNKGFEKVDLTQSFVQCISLKNVDGMNNLDNKVVESMDLTQSSDSNDSLPFVQISGKDKTLDDTIILTDDAYLGVKPLQGNVKKEESYATNNILQNSKDLLNFNDNEHNLILIECESDDGKVYTNSKKQDKSEHKEYPRQSNTSNIAKESVVSKCESFFEEFVHLHSDSSKEHSEDGVLCVNDSPNNSVVHECFNKQQINNDIDLTQSSGSSIENNGIDTVRSKEQLDAISFSEKHKNYLINDCITNDDIMKNDIDLPQSSGSSVESLLGGRDIAESEKSLEDEISLTDRHDIYSNNKSNNSLCKDIDLTQNSNSSTEKNESINSNNTATKDNSAATKISDTNSLGKIGDVSIDYDEIFDDVIASHTNQTNKSDTTEVIETNNSTGKIGCSYSVSNSSKNSDVFEISDNELNYSINQSRHELINRNFDIGGLSIMDDLSKASGSKVSIDVENSTEPRISISESFLPEINLRGTKHSKVNNVVESKSTPFRNVLNEHKTSIKTPANSDYIIKTDQVTPMVDYESLTTPERNRELDKYGLKPFKRKRAIQLLTHLYNQTHPIVESCSIEDLPSPSKKRKKDDNKISNTQVCTSPTKLKKSLAKSKGKSPRKRCENPNTEDREVLEDINKENGNVYRVTNEAPEIKNIECSEEDWVFQKREKVKVHSCRVPLHIAFHNYVSCRQGLIEAILRYEPVNIDVIHKGLVESGHKYDAKELLKFMDKKCITVKTADNNAKTTKKHY